MESSSRVDPYVAFFQDDFTAEEGILHVDLQEDSVTRRIWEYDQNDFFRYVARWNPLGSEEKFLEDRGERFGRSLYTAFDDFMDGEDEVVIYTTQGGKKSRAEPASAARQSLYSLGSGSDANFYSSALETVEEEAFNGSVASVSEI